MNENFPAVQNLVMNREIGLDSVLNQLIPIAYDYLILIEVGSKMNPSAIVLTLKEMISDFPDWSIEDFRYFFRGFAKGNFNEKIFRLDMAVIYEGARKYEAQRTEVRERKIAEQKGKRNSRDHTVTPYSAEGEAFINEFLNTKMKPVKPDASIKEHLKQLEKEARLEWNRIPKIQGKSRHVKHDGKWETIKMSEDVIEIGKDDADLPIYESWTNFKNRYIREHT